MSQAPLESVNINEAEIGPGAGERYPPQSAQTVTQTPQDASNFVDGSGPIFSMYLEMASEEDKTMAESWKADADGILIFTGLFSAAVASLISVSIQDIRPNPQDTSNFYLANIYQTVTNTASSLPASPPPFSPPSYAVWVNALWFLSLVISLTCALLATLLQQWARRYLKVTQPRYSPHKRARIRSFFAEGVGKFLLPWAVESLPALLHVSVFLFFAGLVVFLCNVNLTIFKLVMSWIGYCTALYGCITFMPIFYHDSPYYTSLSVLVWQIVIGILHVVYRVRLSFGSTAIHHIILWDRYRKLFLQGMHKTAEESAFNLPSEIDGRALMWTFDSLDEDHELERFFASLPGFRKSKVVDDPLPSLAEDQKWQLSTCLEGLLGRTFSSDLLTESVKNRRAIISAKAIDPAHIPKASGLIDKIFSHYQYTGPLATEIVQIVRSWGNNTDENTTVVVRATVSSIVAMAELRGNSWFILASDEMQVPETVLREYAARGDSLSLAILIHITRQQFTYFRKSSWPWDEFSEFLDAASESNVKDTQPELQHEFCALWNQIVREVQNNSDQDMVYRVLLPIRQVYVALHEDADSSSTRFSASTVFHENILNDLSLYPMCNVAGHIHDDSTSTTCARAPPVPTSLASLVASSTSPPAPPQVDDSLADVPPLDNDTHIPRSFHLAHQTTIETLCIPPTCPGPVSAHVTQGGIGTSSTTTIPLPTSEPSASTSMAPTSPPGAIAVQHIAYRRTSSGVLDIPQSPSPTPVFHHNMLPTDPQSSLDSPVTGSDHASSSPESLLAPAAPNPPRPRLSSAPDLGAASEDEGNSKAGLRKDKDALDPSSVIHENIMAVPDVPPQSPSPPSVTGVVIAGPSRRSFNAELTGDHPPHPSRGQYDIV